MMKRLLFAALMLVALICAQSANAYLVRVQCRAPDGTAGSVTGQLGGSEPSASFTPLAPPIVPEADYAVYQNNDPVNGALGSTLKFTNSPAAWYGTVIGRGGYDSEAKGGFDLRIFSTTTATKLATGIWYLYKGIAEVAYVGGVLTVTNPTEVELLDHATLSTSQSTWSASTFGAVLEDGDQWTLFRVVPEPTCLITMFFGIGCLAGAGKWLRRR